MALPILILRASHLKSVWRRCGIQKWFSMIICFSHLRLRSAKSVGTRAVLATVFVTLLVASGPVFAQIWIGDVFGRMFVQQAQHQCLMGQSLAIEEIFEASNPASELIATYWRIARHSDRPDDGVSRHVSRSAPLAIDKSQVVVAPKTANDDPITRASASLDSKPESFARAGQRGTARGVWRLRFASGEPAGSYVADFKRKGGVWRLRALRVLPPGEAPPVVTQYCMTPGDVEAYRARIAAVEQARAVSKR